MKMKMKSIDLFCASPASTAICSNMGQRAIARPGPRPVERLGATPKNRTNAGAAPCSASHHLPLDPSRRSYHKSRKNINKSTNLRRKSSADVDDLAGPDHISSTYLLSDRPFLDVIPNSDAHNKYTNKRLDLDNLIKGFRSFSTDEYPIYNPAGSVDSLKNQSFGHDHLTPRKSSSPPSNRLQVVELRVSIHCKGCEGKLRKYISRMEGVTSFSIDLATKKVTVVGNVTPSGVLSSISKVKNAQLWSSSSSSTSSSSPRVSLAR